MVILYFLLFSYLLLSVLLYPVFQKIGLPGWKALMPGLNFVSWCEAVGRPKWWAALLLLPIVNIFIFTGLSVAMVRSFKKYSFWDSAIAVIYAPLAMALIAWNKKAKYDGPAVTKEKAYQLKLAEAQKSGKTSQVKKLMAKNPYYKSQLREWTEAVVFAVFAAAFIRMFVIEAYAIPTSSMEGSLMVGDHLFVSKMNYGIRTPKTIAMIPLLHNRVPLIEKESYWEKPNLPFYWLPALEAIEHDDIVVFNHPEGDSVFITPARNWSIYDLRRGSISRKAEQDIKRGIYPLTTRPVDKIDHYVKRCIGLPGDTLQIIDQQVYLDGKAIENPDNIQFRYLVKHDGPLNVQRFDEWGITQEDQEYLNGSGEHHKMLVLNAKQLAKVQAMSSDISIIPNTMYWVDFSSELDATAWQELDLDPGNIRFQQSQQRLLMTLTSEQAEGLQKLENAPSVQPYDESDRLFPHDPSHFSGWTVDNYGPIWIPKSGTTMNLTAENIALYDRLIRVYEGNKLEQQDGQFFINDEPTNQYTFQQDYYWMMGDNRHNSEDSRVWGFVPRSHVVGKPIFLHFSTKENSILKGINWDRILTPAQKF